MAYKVMCVLFFSLLVHRGMSFNPPKYWEDTESRFEKYNPRKTLDLLAFTTDTNDHAHLACCLEHDSVQNTATCIVLF